jgi:hypothetical protein
MNRWDAAIFAARAALSFLLGAFFYFNFWMVLGALLLSPAVALGVFALLLFPPRTADIAKAGAVFTIAIISWAPFHAPAHFLAAAAWLAAAAAILFIWSRSSPLAGAR